jgi:hypothetical protein
VVRFRPGRLGSVGGGRSPLHRDIFYNISPVISEVI